MSVEAVKVTTGLEYPTDRLCQVGRIVYRVPSASARRFVALTFRYLDEPAPSAWALTWVGIKGEEPAALPPGTRPPGSMLKALAEVTE